MGVTFIKMGQSKAHECSAVKQLVYQKKLEFKSFSQTIWNIKKTCRVQYISIIISDKIDIFGHLIW
jgi:hypothetical protein